MEFSSGEGIGNWNQHDEEVYRLYSGFIIMNGLYFYYLKINLKVNTHLSQDTWMCVAGICVCVCVCVYPQLYPTVCDPTYWDFPSKNTGMGCHFPQ